jgi:hypothetical protein
MVLQHISGLQFVTVSRSYVTAEVCISVHMFRYALSWVIYEVWRRDRWNWGSLKVEIVETKRMLPMSVKWGGQTRRRVTLNTGLDFGNRRDRSVRERSETANGQW